MQFEMTGSVNGHRLVVSRGPSVEGIDSITIFRDASEIETIVIAGPEEDESALIDSITLCIDDALVVAGVIKILVEMRALQEVSA